MGGYNSVHPAFGGFMTDPTAQMGFQVGKTALDAGQQYMEQNVREHLSFQTHHNPSSLPTPSEHYTRSY